MEEGGREEGEEEMLILRCVFEDLASKVIVSFEVLKKCINFTSVFEGHMAQVRCLPSKVNLTGGGDHGQTDN